MAGGPVKEQAAVGQVAAAGQQPPSLEDLYQAPQRGFWCPLQPEGCTWELHQEGKEELGSGMFGTVFRVLCTWTSPDGSKRTEIVVVKELDTVRCSQASMQHMQFEGFLQVLIKDLPGVVPVLAAAARTLDNRVCEYYYIMKDLGPWVRDLDKVIRSWQEKGLGRSVGASCIVSSGIKVRLRGAATARDFRWWKRGVPWAAVELLLHKLVRLLYDLWGAGAVHSDLKGANIVCDPAPLEVLVQHFMEAVQKVEALVEQGADPFYTAEALGRAFLEGDLFEKAVTEFKVRSGLWGCTCVVGVEGFTCCSILHVQGQYRCHKYVCSWPYWSL